MLRIYLLLLFSVCLYNFAYAYKWHRGLSQIDQIDSGIQFTKFGESATEIQLENIPLEFSNLAKFSATRSEKLFFRLSTGIHGKWVGPGKFSIEGVDHNWATSQVSKEFFDESTRSILYINQGLLFINAEALNNESFILVETPMGRVIASSCIFSIKLDKFKDRSQRYATISCYGGSLEFIDLEGSSYRLNIGNKMPIILKDDLFKVDIVVMDELEQRALTKFMTDRANFADAMAFPKVENPTLESINSAELDETTGEGEGLKEYYFFPVIQQVQSFDPYKKSYKDDD